MSTPESQEKPEVLSEAVGAPSRDAEPEKVPEVRSPPPARPGRLSGTLAKAQARAIDVSEEELKAYVPDEKDIEMAQAVLGGALNGQTLARALGISAPAVSARLKDPVRCAWLSRELSSQIKNSIGLIQASLLERALNGNVSAARLLLERYDDIGKSQVNKHLHLHGSLGDISNLTDADLERVVQAEIETAGRS